MIIIRKMDGTAVVIDEPGTFVELVNDMDKTTMMVFGQHRPGAILQILPNTADAARYEQIFSKHGVKFTHAGIRTG